MEMEKEAGGVAGGRAQSTLCSAAQTDYK